MAWNGIDYLLDYNLMLLACEQEVKSGDWRNLWKTTASSIEELRNFLNENDIIYDKSKL